MAETQLPMAEKAFDHGLPSLWEEEISNDLEVPVPPKKQGCIQRGAGAVDGMTVGELFEWIKRQCVAICAAKRSIGPRLACGARL